MKLIITLFTVLLSHESMAQVILPDFLVGAWKVEGKDVYEHWDKLSNNRMKGIAFTNKNGHLVSVAEYLDVQIKNDKVIFSALVIGQNNNAPIEFIGKPYKDSVKFSNVNHDFPQEISYTKVDNNPDRLEVRLTGKEKEVKMYLNRVENINHQESQEISYDEILAEKLGADEYGMKSYFFVILKTGPNKSEDKSFVNESFKGHLSNINKLVQEEKLIVAGPFGKNDDEYRGLFILNNINSIEEAKTVLETDPAIKSGLLIYSIYPWYGSAALPMYLPYSEKATKIKF